MLIHRIIPERHIETLLEGYLYFSPCDEFVDPLEFRFGLCQDAFDLGGDKALAQCVRASFKKPEVERKIANTSISCWMQYSEERAFMWEVYGQQLPAILVTAESGVLQAHLRTVMGSAKTSAGEVQYHFLPSQTHPPFYIPPTDASAKVQFHLFFHKHGYYSYEKEFRMVLDELGPIRIPLPSHLITRVTISPFGRLAPANTNRLREMFAGRVEPSSIKLPYMV